MSILPPLLVIKVINFLILRIHPYAVSKPPSSAPKLSILPVVVREVHRGGGGVRQSKGSSNLDDRQKGRRQGDFGDVSPPCLGFSSIPL